MADFTQIIQEINDDINTNGVGAITGAKLNEVLRDMIAAVNAEKQDPLTIDATPTEDSTNPVQSGGVYEALQDKLDKEELYIRLGFPVFDASLYYSQGDLVVYNGDLYVFTAAHHGQWDANDVEYHDIYKELKDLYVDLAEQIDAKQDTISDLATIRSGAAAGATAYQKPSGGIPKTDLASGVQTSLGKADTAFQKPSGGIPESDLSSDVQQALQKHFKGWYDTLEELKAAHTATDGDSAYVKDASPATTWSIYVYDSTASSNNYWADSGTDADTSHVQTFASNQEVNEVHIVNDLTTGGVNDVLSAEQGVVINEELYDQDIVVLSGDDEEGMVLNANGVVISGANVNYHLVEYDVSLLSGKTLKITANSNWGNCLWAFYNDSTLVQKGDVSANTSAETKLNDYDVIVPNTATILYLSYNLSWDTAVAYYYTEKVSRISALEAEISSIKEIVDLIPTDDMMVNYVSEVIKKYYISNIGDVTSTSSVTYTVSDYIPVNAGEVLYLTASSNYGNALWAFYKSDKSVFSVGQTSASSGTVTEVNKTQVTVPIGAAYVVVARNTNSSLELGVFREEKIIKKTYTGKKWVVVGDSLTEENSATTKHYFDYIAEKTGISTVNMGVGGTGYMRGKDTSKAFYQRISSIDQSADVVTIFGSFNDLNYPVLGFNSMEEALGNYDDDTDATISGCINLTIENLQTAIPLVRLGIVAPCPWASTRPFQSDALMYVDRLKKIAEYHSIPFLDLWRGSNLRPWDADFRALAYTKDLGQDNNPVGTHPDETGHAILAPKFEAFLGELLL